MPIKQILHSEAKHSSSPRIDASLAQWQSFLINYNFTTVFPNLHLALRALYKTHLASADLRILDICPIILGWLQKQFYYQFLGKF